MIELERLNDGVGALSLPCFRRRHAASLDCTLDVHGDHSPCRPATGIPLPAPPNDFRVDVPFGTAAIRHAHNTDNNVRALQWT